MPTPFTGRFASLVLLLATVTACAGGGSSPSTPGWGASLEEIRSAVATAGGYSPDIVDVTASPAHLRISVKDAKLSQADQLTRENSANAIVSAAESVFARQVQLASIQVISVSIVHPAQADGAVTETHTEDVLEFRKGPNQRFAHHIT